MLDEELTYKCVHAMIVQHDVAINDFAYENLAIKYYCVSIFFFSSRRRHTRSVSAFLLNRSSDLFDFLTSNKVWIATDRSRARRCVEACVYGTLDFVGYPRFPAPVEFIAAVIAYYVHPVNIQTACLIMEGAEFTENIIN